MRALGHTLAEKYLGPLPEMSETTRNASLFLVNTHPSFHGSVPTSPFVVQVGGIHLKPKKSLPQEILDIVEKSRNGVVYFSMGSVLRGDSLPGSILEQFVGAFSSLPTEIVWKFEGTLKNKPMNIHLIPWIPQRDLLGHPKVLLFISHCGLLSIEEAVAEGVPVVCIPMFCDQFFNARRVKALGMGESVDFWSLTVTSLKETIDRVLLNPIYKTKALKVKNTFNDRSSSAIDTAVFWVEYVMRHKGAPHLKSPARHLSFHQLHNIDVWAFLVGCTLVILSAIALFARFSFVRRAEKNQRRTN